MSTARKIFTKVNSERNDKLNDIELAGVKGDGGTPLRNLRDSTKERDLLLWRLEHGDSDLEPQSCFKKLPGVLQNFIWKRLLLALTLLILVVLLIVRSCCTDSKSISHVHSFIGLAFGSMIGAALMPFAGPTPLPKRVFVPLVFCAFLLASLYPWIPGTQRGGFAMQGKKPASLGRCLDSTHSYILRKCDTEKKKSGGNSPKYMKCKTEKEEEFRWATTRYATYYIGFVFSTIISIACLLKGHPPSKYVRNTIHCTLTLWMLDLIRFVRQIAIMCSTDRLARDIMINISCALTIISLIWPALLIWRRVDALQRSIERQLHAGLLSHVVIFVSICCLIPYCGRIFDLETYYQASWLEELCESLSRLALMLGFTYATQTFRKLVYVLVVEAERTHGVPRGEALWAARAIKQEAVVVGLYAAMIAVCLIGTIYRSVAPRDTTGSHQNMFWLATLPFTAESILSNVCVSVLAGVLLKYDDASIYMTPLEEQRHRTTSASQRKTENKIPVEESKEWQDKVQELARRGIRLRDILHFYSGLIRGDCMPSFQPMESTTNEVVRLAIIPSSVNEDRSGGHALAYVLNKGEERMAEKMVSHSWGNTFSHLVAAMVADSLSMTSFDAVQLRLCSEEGVKSLLDLLISKGTIDTVYWICAFCVNQHAGICGGFGPEPTGNLQMRQEWDKKRRDHVTGQMFPLCHCKEPKFFSDAPIECEMNKFDSMMKFLSTPENQSSSAPVLPPSSFSTASSFSQVIAVDPEFELFERAWCVAELGIAYEMDIPQNMVINSRGTLEDNYHKLSELTIRNCRASRDEDKQMILAKIPHMRTFDQHLQYLIFGQEGLLKSWMDGPGRLANAGLVVSRALRRAAQSPFDDLAHLSAGHEDSPTLTAMDKPWFMSAPPPACSVP